MATQSSSGIKSSSDHYATLDGTRGAIKIGNGSDVLDNASIVASSGRGFQASEVLIGNSVVIGFGAKVIGPSTIGSYADSSKPVSIGANAVIDGATIEPGVIVSPLARVGPGVIVPTGYMVLPGANVTTDAEASNPKLGMVVPVTASSLATITKNLSENKSLAAGYIALYQGNSATGASPGASPVLSGINNGDLAAILGANQQPGSSAVSFEPAKSEPEFLSPRQRLVGSILSNFPARITGGVQIDMRAAQAALAPGSSQRHPRRPRAADRDRLDRSHRPPRDDQFTAGRPAHHWQKLPCRQRRRDPEWTGSQRQDRRQRQNRGRSRHQPDVARLKFIRRIRAPIS